MNKKLFHNLHQKVEKLTKSFIEVCLPLGVCSPNLSELENMCTVCTVRFPFPVEITWVLLNKPNGH